MIERINFVSTSNAELLTLRLMLLGRPMNSFRDVKGGKGGLPTYRDASVAILLFEDSNEQ